MRIKLVTLGEAGEDVRAAFDSFTRAKVAEFVARPGTDGSEDWPYILRLLAGLVAECEGDMKFPQHVADQVANLSDESLATIAAMAGKMAQLLTMTPQQMIETHHAEGDAPTGYAIAAFMQGHRLGGAEVSMVAHLLTSLRPDQRNSLVSMAAAFLSTFGFTAESVVALNYPGKDDGQ